MKFRQITIYFSRDNRILYLIVRVLIANVYIIYMYVLVVCIFILNSSSSTGFFSRRTARRHETP